MIFLDLVSFGDLDFQRRDRNLSGLIKNTFICISKINQSLMGLEQHEGVRMMTE